MHGRLVSQCIDALHQCFLVYINDIVLELNCSISLFADDTSLYIIVENPQAAANMMNSSLSCMV